MGIVGDWVGNIRKQGIHVPDNLIYIPIDSFQSYQEKENYTTALLSQLPAGITEIYFHPSLPVATAAVHKDESYRQVREWDYRLLNSDRLREVLHDSLITLTDFRQLRELTRRIS